MATQERRAITERTIVGKREKATQGGFACGSAPLGYRRDRQGWLAVDEDEAGVVRLIHDLSRQRKTLQEIVD